MPDTPRPPVLDSFDLADAERLLCIEALRVAGGKIQVAASMLGITRHAMRRRIDKLEIPWTRSAGVVDE